MYMFHELSFYAKVATIFKILLSEYSCSGTQSVGGYNYHLLLVISLLYKLVTLPIKSNSIGD